MAVHGHVAAIPLRAEAHYSRVGCTQQQQQRDTEERSDRGVGVGCWLSYYFFVIKWSSNRWLLLGVILFCYQTIIKSLGVACRYTFLLSNYHRIVGCCLSLYVFAIKLSPNRWLLRVVILFCYQTIIKSTCGVHSRVQWNTTRVTHVLVMHES